MYHSECSDDNSRYFIIMEDLRLRVPAIHPGDEVRSSCSRLSIMRERWH